LQELQVFM